jgi:hypothetical protein
MSETPPVNPYAAPQAPTGAAAGETGQFQYKPLAGRTQAVVISLSLFCLFTLLAIVMGVGVGSSGQSMSEAWADETPITPSDLLELGEGLSILLSIFTLCLFLPRANRNSRALSGESLRFSPASTVWWFFVPFMNLVRPYQAVKEIWHSSTAGPQEAWFAKPAPGWLLLWWGTWIAFNVLVRLTQSLSRGAGSPDTLSTAEMVALLGRITGTVAAVCLIYIVTRIARTQAKRFEARPIKDLT